MIDLIFVAQIIILFIVSLVVLWLIHKYDIYSTKKAKEEKGQIAIKDPIAPALFFVIGAVVGSYLGEWLVLPLGIAGALIGIYLTNKFS